MIHRKGKILKSKAFNIQFLKDENLNQSIYVGFTATKKLGNSVKRNKAKRIARELARKVISKYGKINSYYVLITKPTIFKMSFQSQENELKKMIS